MCLCDDVVVVVVMLTRLQAVTVSRIMKASVTPSTCRTHPAGTHCVVRPHTSIVPTHCWRTGLCLLPVVAIARFRDVVTGWKVVASDITMPLQLSIVLV